MSRGLGRAERLRDLEKKYLYGAYTDEEMAELVGLGSRSTIYKDRMLLMDEGVPFVEVEHGRWKIDRQRYLSEIKVNINEAAMLYLMARRAARQTRRPNPHVLSLLRAIAVVLGSPLMDRLLRTTAFMPQPTERSEEAAILEKVVSCWVEGCKIRIRYQGLQSRKETVHLVSPYLLEPSLWSEGIYLVGYSEKMQRIVPFKLNRIVKAADTTQPIIPPTDFDESTFVRDVWGIWSGEGELVTVKLRFRGETAVRRVLEDIWHPNQEEPELLENGDCIWTAQVAEWREMLPWIRGWGADVEVLEPIELREELEQTTVRLNELYETTTPVKLLHHLPYAKTNRNKQTEIHLLIYHLIDVGQVALAMWQDVLTKGVRRRLSQMLNLDEGDCGRFLAFTAALHDIGKAGPAYQKKYASSELKSELTRAGLVLDGIGRAYDKTTPHGTVSTWALSDLLPEFLGIDDRVARKLAIAVGGHHGIWPQPDADFHIDDHKHKQWDTLRRDLIWELKAVFDPPIGVSLPKSTTDQNAFLTILSGLTSVADWIGSRNDECFGYVERAMSSRQYSQRSATKAAEGLQDLGWMGWQPDGKAVAFTRSFSYLEFDSPRPIQRQVIDTTCELSVPSLLILEAPTGTGKSEAALHVADTILQQHGGRGLYVAMPTQATSNQMYGRVGQFLKHRYPDMPINYHLVHGQAVWMDGLKKEVELQGVGDDDQAHVAAESWFIPRKRTLLAPFGVGTVDQTLLSILQTKHFFVRLFGLSHKVVIFDEVHAYDTYMNTLFHRLLEWLSAIGTSVIILSATLPAKTRRDLVQAYTGEELEEAEAAYPTLTIANAQKQETIDLPKPEPYTLQLDWSVGRQPQEIAGFLQGQLSEGGCVAVICNTVQRAQDVYRAIKEADIVPQDELLLFHSRFPPVWRRETEERVLRKFSKNSNRPHKAIVVATQVIEQSLDLDFDVMVTDLAPVDLMLQRAGRLHRHKRNAQVRRNHSRCLTITRPEFRNDIPDFGPDRFVYGDYLLLRSYLTLHARTHVVTPDDTVPLVESVYGNSDDNQNLSETWQKALNQAWQRIQTDDHETQAKAAGRLVNGPSSSRLLYQRMLGLEEENPEVHATFRANTRDIDFSVTLICLNKTNSGFVIYDGAELRSFDLEAELPSDLPKKLLQNAVSLQHKGLVRFFIDQELPSAWRESAKLRYCRYTIFENGVCELPQYILLLDQEFGLQIIKKEGL